MDTTAPRPEDGTEADGPNVDMATPAYPLDDTLRINHIQCKGTHNSTHIAPEGAAFVPDWNYTHAPLDQQLADLGVRQVELDVHYMGDGSFDVFHVPVVDELTTCRSFVTCLQTIKDWSDLNPQHHILFILVEPKDEYDLDKITGHYDELDAAILSVWPTERVLRPDDVRNGHATLREALESDGWPTLGATRQKAMFIMLDGGEHKTAYLEGHPNLEGRVIFMRGGQGEPTGAILEMNDPVGSLNAINDAALAGYLVRSDADNASDSEQENQAKATAALATGAHFISSDFPGITADSEYFFDVGGETPSRCNPVTAPRECTAEDIE
jgi:hypothetical protein